MQNKLLAQTFVNTEFYEKFSLCLKPSNESIKVLMLGDVLGRGGRKIVKKIIPQLKTSLNLDFITINGENLAGGFGVTSKIFEEIINIGIDAVTMGNHWKDKNDIHSIRIKHKELVLPQNLLGVSDVSKVPSFYLEKRNKYINIINLMGNFAMKEEYANPFEYLKKEKNNFLDKVKSGSHIVIADIHAEASSEKQAIAWYYDGILAGLIGTHTHTPTSDERLTVFGTAFLTDVGMTGPYDSVIGMDKVKVLNRFINPAVKIHYEVAEEDLWLSAFLLEISPTSGLSVACHRLQCRGYENEIWNTSSVTLM